MWKADRLPSDATQYRLVIDSEDEDAYDGVPASLAVSEVDATRGRRAHVTPDTRAVNAYWGCLSATLVSLMGCSLVLSGYMWTLPTAPAKDAKRWWPDLPEDWADRECRWDCGKDDFNAIMTRRVAWKIRLEKKAGSKSLRDHGLDQDAVCSSHWWGCADDKLGGFVFARSEGVRTPSILGYIHREGGSGHSPKDLLQICAELTLTHKRFIMKPLNGQASRGVWKYDDGAWTKLAFKPEERYTVRSAEPPKEMVRDAVERSPIIFESFVDPPPGKGDMMGSTTDHKFLMVGETVLGVQLKFWGDCDVYVDENYERVDKAGCFHQFQEHGNKNECNHYDVGRLCTQQQMEKHPKPPCWSELVHTAKKLGRRMGTQMRIDLFYDTEGPVLGEFTPYHAAGLYTCVAPVLPNGKVDYCFSGRVWNAYTKRTKNRLPPRPAVFNEWSTTPLLNRLDTAMKMTSR